MKQLKSILLATLVLTVLTLSCIEPFEPVPDGRNCFPDNALVITPEVLGAPITKAGTIPGVDALDENILSTLDVFVYRKNGGTNEFFHRYTVTAEAGSSLLSKQDYLLEGDWRSVTYNGVGYAGNTFKVYVVANLGVNVGLDGNPLSIPGSPTEAQLQQLVSLSKISHPVQYGYACYDVVRLVDGHGPGNEDWYNAHIASNLFLMDGVIDNWTPDNSQSQQYFTKKVDKTFELARAAAKFHVQFRFADAFLESLGSNDYNGDGTPDGDVSGLDYTKVTETWLNGNKKTEVVTRIGNPQYKFANILPATYNFDPAGSSNVTSDALSTFRDDNLWDSQSRFDFTDRPAASSGAYPYKYPYQTTTYSYAFGWKAEDAALMAPALTVSLIYTITTRHYDSDGHLFSTDEPKSVTSYYRIPLVNVNDTNEADPATEISRNTFYDVDAIITSMGTSISDIDPTPVKVINYKVLPWVFNEAKDVTEVEGAELYYFSADTEYSLRGEGEQSVYLNFYTPKSEKLTTGHYDFEPELSNVRVYYKPDESTTTNINVFNENVTTTDGDGHWQWQGTKNVSGEKVTITVLPYLDGGGRVLISSDVLKNRAIKYIEFDASVTFDIPVLDANGIPIDMREVTVTRHYRIAHYPLDNIQSVVGLWSSRWDGSTNPTTVYYRKRYSRTTEVTQAQWATGVGTSNTNRMNANSAATAVNGYYATGNGGTTTLTQTGNTVPRTNTPTITWSNTGVTIRETDTRTWTITNQQAGGTYDFVTYTYTTSGSTYNPTRTGTATFSKYARYYHYETSYTTPSGDGWTWEWEECTEAQHNAAAAENKKTETYAVPSTGVWPAYSPQKSGTTNQGRYYGDTQTGYNAKVFNASLNDIRLLTTAGASGNDANTAGNNTHMYIIQISKAGVDNDGNPVIIGRPHLDAETHMSDDDVVSPAFMIASQLGSVARTAYHGYPERAAAHCHSYMEVDGNGRRFVNWRLPTAKEIAYIAGYQNDQNIQGQGTFSYVLAGNFYYALDGSSAVSHVQPDTPGYEANDTYIYVRCVRDLTLAEVEELNTTGRITAASY